jgi:hypothetical protein
LNKHWFAIGMSVIAALVGFAGQPHPIFRMSPNFRVASRSPGDRAHRRWRRERSSGRR